MVIIQGRPELVSQLLNVFLIATLIPFIRYVIGIKHWRNYSTITLGVSAFLFANTFKHGLMGITIWLYFFIVMQLFALLTYAILKDKDLHYYARLGIIYSIGTAALLVSAVLLTYVTQFNPLNYNFSTLGLLLLLLPLDDLTLLRLRKSSIEYMRRLFGTALTSLTIAAILLYDKWNTYLYLHQELLIIFLIALAIISQWRQINLSDFLRFKSIAKSNLDNKDV